jgi:2-dehydropantoate 2-reductase
MTREDNWPRIAVVGAGAVGGYFGGLMARAGAPVVMIGRQSFVDAVKTKGIFLDTLHFKEFVHVEASTELDAARGADIVFFCVKTTDNELTARALEPLLAPESIVVSLQNGVDNVEQLRAAANITAVQAVVYVAASVPQPGHVKHVGRGDLVIGPETEQTQILAALLGRTSVPYRMSDNINGELWIKLIANCALNAISALGQAKYGRIAENANARVLIAAVVQEVLAVAGAAGIVLPGIETTETAMAGAMKIAAQMPDALSSTAQDLNRGKCTEIDSLNGFIAGRGLQVGVLTPMNKMLFTLVKLAEGGERCQPTRGSYPG